MISFSDHITEIFAGRSIGNAVEWNGNVVVYSHSDDILFMVSGKLVSFTSFRVNVKVDKLLITYDNLGQIVSTVPSP